ncbi:MAG: hypothetical protein JO306_00300 [Gemmatimonadetes bacterium]|nr:hypothetical protein [Gemmatimonadota bacterium]
MSTTQINFNARLLVGGQTVPLASEIVVGDGQSQDGVENGFLFKLDLQPGEPPVVVNLGDVIAFVEQKLGAGAGSLASNPGLAELTSAFGSAVAGPATFNSQNSTLVDIREFTLNSTASKTLFSLNIDIEGADPTTGLIALPPAIAQWVRINALAISFSSVTTS